MAYTMALVSDNPNLVVYIKNLPIYISPVPDLLTWKEDTFQNPWDHLDVYTFTSFIPVLRIVNQVMISYGLVDAVLRSADSSVEKL